MGTALGGSGQWALDGESNATRKYYSVFGSVFVGLSTTFLT